MPPSDPELWIPDPGAAAPVAARAAGWGRRAAAILGTLKFRLTLAAISSLVLGIAFISAMSLSQVERDLLAQAQARELARTAAAAKELSVRAVSLQQALRATAELVQPDQERQLDSLERILYAQPVLLQQFTNLFAAAPDGTLRLAIDEAGTRLPRVTLSDREYFQQAVAEKRPVISGAVPGRLSGEPVVVFLHPIVRRGAVTLVIGGALRLASRSLAAPLLDHENASEPDDLLAISSETGIFMAHPQRDWVVQRVSAEPRLAAAFRDWQERGSPSEPTGLLLRQPGEMVTAAGVAGTGWLVWRAIPEATLLEPLERARWQAFRNAAGAIAVLGLFTFGLVWWLLRPLGRLEARALHLFDASRSLHEGWPSAGGEVGSLTHVLKHVGAERAHLESFTGEVLGRLNSVMKAAPVGIAFTRHQRFELINPAWCRMLMRTESEMLGKPAADIFASGDDYEQLGPLVQRAFQASGEYTGEWRFRRKDGSLFWGQLSGRPVAQEHPQAGTIWTCVDVTAARASRENLEWSATHDPLTGLANRAAFEARLRGVLGHPPAALIMIDLDRFKPINDQHGHAAGDAMLKLVASTLVHHVRAGDLAVRTGGDEFALVLERCPEDAARRVAGEVLQAIERAELHWEDQRLRVGASIGLAPLSPAFASTEAWLAAADAACYDAKAAGRGVVRLASGGSARIIELPTRASPG